VPEHPNAKRIVDKLDETAKELEFNAARAEGNERILLEFDARNVREAIDLIKVLDTEVFRLRAAIGHHHYGQMSGPQLRAISQTWNDDQ
jgi:hypothetical protein